MYCVIYSVGFRYCLSSIGGHYQSLDTQDNATNMIPALFSICFQNHYPMYLPMRGCLSWRKMQKSIMTVSKFSLQRQTYESPKVEVVEIVPQGILCASGGASATYAGGGTESMNLTDVNWP